jgi:hypothetical protein
MTPTLFGRLQSRFFLLLFVGLPWTLIISPFLPGFDGAGLTDIYFKATFRLLALVCVLGLVIWEPIYHYLQQFRWEKDWPSLFALLLGIPEGILAWLLSGLVLEGDGGAPAKVFVPMFVTVWILVWLMAIGPIKVFLIRYRFRGGKFIGKWG